MNIVLVHGMGRTSLSWLITSKRFRAKGHSVFLFNYSTAKESFNTISSRLSSFLEDIQSKGDYIVIGHSLGGILLRSALHELGSDKRQPITLYLLGSPVKSALLARKLKTNTLFNFITSDCGQLLASQSRMLKIPASQVETVSFTGTRGLYGPFSPFGEINNDLVVSEEEAHADWITTKHKLPIIHTVLPSSKRIFDIIIRDIEKKKFNRPKTAF